jgi:UDP-N-acetylmuramate dehydrogenase
MKIEQNIPLAEFTTFKVGGPADYFARVHDEAELREALRFAAAEHLPIFVLGGGSNVLFTDAGFRGLVIKNEIAGIEFNGAKVRVGSGASLAQLVLGSIQQNLAGLENLIGLPGTVGGAIAGNAGSYGAEIGTVVESAQILQLPPFANVVTDPDLSGEASKFEITEIDPNWFEFGYRTSKLKNSRNYILISVTLQLTKSAEDLRAKATETAKTRASKEPGGLNAGSFWQNPPEKKTWELIDACGLRGERIGDAQVSPKHANYLVNLGNATATDLIKLAKKVEVSVQAKFSIELKREVICVPEAGYPN